MATIQEQIGQLDALRSSCPGLGIDKVKAEIDEWVKEVMAITGEGLGGVEALRGIAEAAKQQLDNAAAAIAQLPLEVSSIVSRLQNA